MAIITNIGVMEPIVLMLLSVVRLTPWTSVSTKILVLGPPALLAMVLSRPVLASMLLALASRMGVFGFGMYWGHVVALKHVVKFPHSRIAGV